MSTYAAVGMMRGENARDAVEAFIRVAAKRQLKFEHLEVMGLFNVGSRQLVRFRTDGSWSFAKLLKDLAERPVVTHNGSGFQVQLPGGRQGSVPTATMLGTAMAIHRQVYRGPGHELWEAQFAA